MASLSAARAAAYRFTRSRWEATLGADTGEALTGFQTVGDKAAEFAREKYEATVGANTTPGRRTLSGFDDVMRRYSRSWGQQGIRARVTADIQRGVRQLRLLERYAEGLEEGEHKVRVEAEIRRARERLEGLKRLGESLGVQSSTMTVGLRGAAATTAQMMGLQRLADRLDGYNIRMSARADVDETLSNVLPNALGAVELQLTRYKSVQMGIAAVSAPLFYTSVAAIPAVASAAAGAVGSLAITLGKGLVGGFTAAAGAAGMGGAALVSYYAAVNRTVNYVGNLTDTIYGQLQAVDHAGDVLTQAQARLKKAEKGTREYRNASRGLALAQENQRYEQAKLNALYDIATPRVMKLQRSVNDARIRMLRMGGAVMNAVAPAIMLGLRQFDRFGEGIQKGAVQMFSDMDTVAQGFIRAASKGRNLENITTILEGIKSSGVPALKLAGNAAFTLLNFLSPVVPTSLSVLRNLTGLSAEARRWSSSAEGQREIASTWEELFSTGKRLYGIALDLGSGLWGVKEALEASGTGNYLLGQIERLAAGFEHTMEAGGKGRRTIVRFMRDSRPLLRAGVSLAEELGTQFGRLARRVMDVQQPGGQNTLAVILRSMEKSVKPLVNFLIHEFEEIGPMLPGLIKNISKWFATFAAATPEMKLFLRTFNRILGAFNSLPKDQRIAIARTIAWIGVIKALGGGAVLGAIGSFVSAFTGALQTWQIWRNQAAVKALTTSYKDLARAQTGAAMAPTGRAGRRGAPAVIPTRYATPRPLPRTVARGMPPVIIPAGYATPRPLPKTIARGAPPVIIPTGYGKPRGKPPVPGSPGGGAPLPPLIIPTGFDTSRGKARQLGGRLGALLRRVPVLGPAIALGGRLISPIGRAFARMPIGRWITRTVQRVGIGGVGRLIGSKLIGGALAFLTGPLGWAYLIADTVTGGAITRGAFGLVKDFIRGWRRGWRSDRNWLANLFAASFRGLFAMLRLGAIVEGFKRRYRRSMKRGKVGALGSETVTAIAQGILGALHQLPLVGPFIKWLDRNIATPIANFLEIGSPSRKAGRWGRAIVDGLKQGILSTPLGGLVQKVWRALDDVWRWMKRQKPFASLGESMASGIAQGIGKGWRWVSKALDWIARAAPKWVRRLLGIRSPSTVFARIGDQIVAGMEGSMRRGTHRVARAARDLAAASSFAARPDAVSPVPVVSAAGSGAGIATLGSRGASPHRVSRERYASASPTTARRERWKQKKQRPVVIKIGEREIEGMIDDRLEEMLR